MIARIWHGMVPEVGPMRQTQHFAAGLRHKPGSHRESSRGKPPRWHLDVPARAQFRKDKKW